MIGSNFHFNGSREPPSLEARAAVARAGPGLGSVLRPGIPLLPARLHAGGRLPRRLRPPDATPLRLLRGSAPAPARVGGHRGGGAAAASRDRGLPRRHRRRPHAVRGSAAQQPAQQGDELLPREALPTARDHAALPRSAAEGIQGAGEVAGEPAQGMDLEIGLQCWGMLLFI